MKTSEIRKLSVEEVELWLEEATQELWSLKFRATTENLENPILIRDKRRDIARMKTILKEHRDNTRRLAQREDEGASA